MSSRETSLQLPLAEIQFGAQYPPWPIVQQPLPLGVPAYFIPAAIGVGDYSSLFSRNPAGPGELYRIYGFTVAYGVIIAVATGWTAGQVLNVTMIIMVDNLQAYSQQQQIVPIEDSNTVAYWYNGVFGSSDLINPITLDRRQNLSILFSVDSRESEPQEGNLIIGCQAQVSTIIPFQSSLNYYIDNQ